MTRRNMLIGITVLAIAGIILLHSAIQPDEKHPAIDTGEVKQSPTAKLGMDTQQQPAPSPTKSDAPLPFRASEAKLNGEIAKHIALGTPEGRLNAHLIVSECMAVEERKRFGVNDASDDEKIKACQAIDQQYRRDSQIWLKQAVEAKAKGGAVQFLAAGPNGSLNDLQTRPTDPLILEWKNTALAYLERDAKAGDYVAAVTLSAYYATGSPYTTADPAIEIGYFIAAEQLKKLSGDPFNKGVTDSINRRFNSLSQEDQVKAVSIAKKITG